MQVLLSGQAGLFAVQTATGFAVERLDDGVTHQADHRDIAYYFAGCNDVASLTVKSADEARRATEKAWAADRAVRLFVMILDPSELPEDLVEVGDALDELLAEPDVTPLVEFQIFAAPLPEPIDVKSVREALNNAPLSAALLDRFLHLQSIIGRVRTAFDMIGEDMFEARGGRGKFFEAAIDSGSVRTLVLAAASEAGVNSALFDLYTNLRGLENSRAIIQAWTQSFERTHHFVAPQFEVEEDFFSDSDVANGVAGREAYERVIQQQVAIVDRVRDGDFDVARRFARELVVEQQRSGTAEHIAKSLSNLSQRAKELEVYELALEWARQAVEIKGDDAVAHAQLADILMRVGRYVEASHHLDLAQSFGEEGFAASGRARILRYQGQYAEALEAYRAAYERTKAHGDRAHFDLAGIAECLRDLEMLDDALAAYDDALAKFEYESVLHAGRAATLVEMGRFEEAFDGYVVAKRLDSKNAVPRNGIASLQRRAGQFERAETGFRAIIADYPFDSHARGGLVGLLRDMGRYEEAVAEAQTLVDYLPASSDARWSLVDAQIDARQFAAAEATLEMAVEDQRHVAGLRGARARIEKAKGNYTAALAEFDLAARDFPSNGWIQLGRADILRRLGNTAEALRIYESAYARHPHRLSLRSALASIYIYQRRFEDAVPLLTVKHPRTADEWRNFALRGMLEAETGATVTAKNMFERGIAECPFRRELNMLRGALSRLHLQDGETVEAVAVASECSGDVTEILKFHASATQEDKGPARALYERLQNSFLPEPYHELREEIARQYNVIDFPAGRDREWLLARESDALLLEAA